MGSAVGAIVGQKFIATQDGTGVNEPRRCQDDARRRSVSVLSAIGRGYVCRRESAPGGTVSPVSVSISGVPWGGALQAFELTRPPFSYAVGR